MAFNNTMIFNEPAIGSPAGTWGSNLFVVHNAASVADTKWNEPNVLVAAYTDGIGGQGTNSQEIVVPDAGLNLELFIAQDDAGSIGDHTILCGVYGKVPIKQGVSGRDRKWPSDIGTITAATATISFATDNATEGQKFDMTDYAGLTKTYICGPDSASNGDLDSDGNVIWRVTGDHVDAASALRLAIIGANGHNGTIGVVHSGGTGNLTLTQQGGGVEGNTAFGGGPVTNCTIPTYFTGGAEAATTFGDPTDMWVPLQNMEATWVAKDNAGETTEQCETVQLQTDGTLAPIKYDVSGAVWYMFKRTSVYLSGCTSVCVSVQAADSLPANAMIVGRFVG